MTDRHPYLFFFFFFQPMRHYERLMANCETDYLTYSTALIISVSERVTLNFPPLFYHLSTTTPLKQHTLSLSSTKDKPSRPRLQRRRSLLTPPRAPCSSLPLPPLPPPELNSAWEAFMGSVAFSSCLIPPFYLLKNQNSSSSFRQTLIKRSYYFSTSTLYAAVLIKTET